MPVATLDGGETLRTTTAADVPLPADTTGQVMDRWAYEQDAPASVIAGWLGWPEGTFRRYRNDEQSPTVARVVQALDRQRRQAELDELRFRLLVLWAGGRFLIVRPEPAPTVPNGGADQARELRRLAIAVQRDTVDLQAAVDDALADGRIDAAEVVRIDDAAAVRTGRVKALLAYVTAAYRRTARPR